MTRYCYSIVDAEIEREFFDADSDTREGAVAAGTLALKEHSDLWPDTGQTARIYTAEIVPAEEYLRESLYAAAIGLDVVSSAEDHLDDFIAYDGRLVEISDEQAANLGRRIIDALVEYGAFKAWGIKDVVAHDVVVGDTK